MSPRRRRLPTRPRREPVGPWGEYVNDLRVRKGWSYKKMYDLVNAAADDDGEPNTRYGRHTIRNWIGGVVPTSAETLRWIATAWNEPIATVSGKADAHRTWRYEQRVKAAAETQTPAPQPDLQLTPAADQAIQMDESRRQFLLAGTYALGQLASASSPRITDEAIKLAAWVEQTNVRDDAVASLAEATNRFAENHGRIAPRRALDDVLNTLQHAQSLLRDGKPRLRQTRELYKIESDLLAHACILLGDLHNDEGAIAYGVTAALYAREAGASQAAALSAQAKTERWRGRYAASADLARHGFNSSLPTPLRILLACQEANAAALLGDHDRAQRALKRAEEAASTPLTPDSGLSPWSCPRPRQALYALSVAIQTRNPEMALQAAEMADAGWASGEPWVHGTWAQVRFGAGIAHVMMEELDGAAEQLRPAMAMPPEFRLATVTNYLVHMDARLQHTRFQGSSLAAALREQIRDFNSAALPADGTIESND